MRFAVTDGTDRRSEGGSGENRLSCRRLDRAAEQPRRQTAAPGRRAPPEVVPDRWQVKVDGMIETYNLFNHENYGSYTTNMANANFGRPSANAALAYQPRMMQLGVKFTF
jgi:hypothetical protein